MALDGLGYEGVEKSLLVLIAQVGRETKLYFKSKLLEFTQA
jgi:hypothetical protein